MCTVDMSERVHALRLNEIKKKKYIEGMQRIQSQ